MDKKKQEQMVDFIINKNLELGKTLNEVILISLKELANGSTDSEAVEFHTAVKEEASRRLRTETRLERFSEFSAISMENGSGLTDEEMSKMLQDEYDRMEYLDPPTDNIDI
jgi:hypothetical protein